MNRSPSSDPQWISLSFVWGYKIINLRLESRVFRVDLGSVEKNICMIHAIYL